MGATALVIGAGIAGLCAARTLSDRFSRVVVLDRDELPDAAVPRRGVTQGGHGHVLLVAGQRALGELFDGLMDELVEAGGVRFDPGTELSFYRFGAIWPREPSELRLVTFSRPLLELAIRRRVEALPEVSIRDTVSVAALEGTAGDRPGHRGPAGRWRADRDRPDRRLHRPRCPVQPLADRARLPGAAGQRGQGRRRVRDPVLPPVTG